MDRLWAPWRIKYLTLKKQKGCIFCKSLKPQNKKELIFSNKHSFCILNAYPYNNGHVMVSPKRHVKELSQLKDPELIDLFKTLNTAKELLDKVLKPAGYNIGINVSRCAGAGIIGHLHIHIVPRWNGDTNFMPALNNTRVISQSLGQLRKILRSSYAKSSSN